MAAALIAKAILGAIGGGFEGASKGQSSQQVQGGDIQNGNDFGSANAMGDKNANPEGIGKESSDTSSKMKVAKGILGAIGSGASGASSSGGSAMSDENLKSVYQDIPDDIVEKFAMIDALDFTYKPEAQEMYQGEKGVDSNEHIGVSAQQLAANPVTSGVVNKDENGNLEVDTRHLAFADTAVIGELSRRILELESRIRQLENK